MDYIICKSCNTLWMRGGLHSNRRMVHHTGGGVCRSEQRLIWSHVAWTQIFPKDPYNNKHDSPLALGGVIRLVTVFIEFLNNSKAKVNWLSGDIQVELKWHGHTVVTVTLIGRLQWECTCHWYNTTRIVTTNNIIPTGMHILCPPSYHAEGQKVVKLDAYCLIISPLGRKHRKLVICGGYQWPLYPIQRIHSCVAFLRVNCIKQYYNSTV